MPWLLSPYFFYAVYQLSTSFLVDLLMTFSRLLALHCAIVWNLAGRIQDPMILWIRIQICGTGKNIWIRNPKGGWNSWLWWPPQVVVMFVASVVASVFKYSTPSSSCTIYTVYAVHTVYNVHAYSYAGLLNYYVRCTNRITRIQQTVKIFQFSRFIYMWMDEDIQIQGSLVFTSYIFTYVLYILFYSVTWRGKSVLTHYILYS